MRLSSASSATASPDNYLVRLAVRRCLSRLSSTPTGFYADVADSTWLGGKASEDGGLHERLPYWMNGAVTLAFLLPEDGPVVQAEAPICPARIGFPHASGLGREAVQPPQICTVRSSNDSFSLRGEVSRIIYAILDAQTPDGWYGGPANNDPTGADQFWPSWYLLYAMLDYAEAHAADEARIQDSLLLYVAELQRRLDAVGMTGWSAVRWPELVAILQRMVDQFNLPPQSPENALLLSTAAKVAGLGFDWIA